MLVGDGATTPANAVVLREGRVAAVGTRDAMVRIAAGAPSRSTCTARRSCPASSIPIRT